MPLKKKTSFVWSHFGIVVGKKRAICNHCHQELAYTLASMSNLGRHIKNKHPEIYTAEMNKISIEEAPVYAVQEVKEIGQEGTSHFKTYEISVKGFEDMEQDITQSEQSDPNWNPETTGDWRSENTSIANNSNHRKERKVSKRSVLWDHFEKSADKTFGQCLHCGKRIKLGTISNLARHLRQKHPTTPIIPKKSEDLLKVKQCSIIEQDDQDILRNEVEICTEVIEINVDDIQNPLNIIETKIEVCNNTMEEDLEYNNNRSDHLAQESQTEFLNDSEEFDITDYIRPKKTAVVAEHVDRQLVKMIVKGCHSVDIVEQSSFKEFVGLLNSKYVLPSANKVAKELIPEMYREYEKKACVSLKAAEGICLYVDQWKSKSSIYMCITAHFINLECKFESIFLTCHVLPVYESIVDLSNRLLETVKDWEISEKIVAVVTDNTDVMSAAVELCKWSHIPHFLRSLSIVIHECLQTIKQLVCKVKNIIDEITSTPEVVAKIYSTQKSLNLPQVKFISKVKCDWNSSFTTVEMLSRFIVLRTGILEEHHKYSGLKLSENEWKIVSSVVDIFSVFKEVKKELIKEGRVCVSKVVYYIQALKSEIKKFQNLNTVPSDAVYLATKIESAMEKQFKGIKDIDFVTNILLLDPRLKKYVFEDESEFAMACSKLKKEVCEVAIAEPQYCEPNPNSLWWSFDMEVKKMNSVKDPIGKGIAEVEKYLQEQLLDRDKDPLVWWDQRSAIYPRLFKLAKKYLCVTARFSARESISFKTAHMLSRLKYSDGSPSESEIMFLHHNM